MGALIALEAVRYLTGFAPPVSAGKLWLVDFATGRSDVGYAWPRLPDCPVCGPDARAGGRGTRAGAAAGPAPAAAGAGRRPARPRSPQRRPTAGGGLAPGGAAHPAPPSVVPQGEAFLVGDPEAGTFLALPAVGLVAVRALQAGAPSPRRGGRPPTPGRRSTSSTSRRPWSSAAWWRRSTDRPWRPRRRPAAGPGQPGCRPRSPGPSSPRPPGRSTAWPSSPAPRSSSPGRSSGRGTRTPSSTPTPPSAWSR